METPELFSPALRKGITGADIRLYTYCVKRLIVEEMAMLARLHESSGIGERHEICSMVVPLQFDKKLRLNNTV